MLRKEIGNKPYTFLDEPLNCVIFAHNMGVLKMMEETQLFLMHWFQLSIKVLKKFNRVLSLPMPGMVYT